MSEDTDPQAAIDAQREKHAHERDDRVYEYAAGDEQEGIPFIGAGPGHPRLLTVAGKEALEAADLVVHAGSLVNSEVLDAYCDDAELVNSVGKDLEELVPLMRDGYEDGREHEGVPTYLVPGVTSAFAASATLRTQLTLNETANHVAFTRPQGKTLDAEDDHIAEFVEMGDVTTCLYLGTHAEDIIEGTIETIGEKVETAGYRASALVMIGDAAAGAGYERSYLYGGWANSGENESASDD